jgi:predicted dehydrogenase
VADPARTGPVGVGLIGAGTISPEYVRNLAAFPVTRVVAIGDLVPDVARARAEEFGVPLWGDPAAVLAAADVELIVNLTIPAAHAEVGRAAIAAGKHHWNEKPLAASLSDARELVELGSSAGLRIGVAPDTFLGPALQTARRLIEAGEIGEPLTALALMQSPGPDAWHPNPAFLFQEGAGPLFDIGPYYLTALVQLFGSIERVAATGSVARSTRTIGAGPNAGRTFPVTAPTYVAALVGFAGGRSAELVLSFDSPQPRILLEVTGTEATLILPDPNTFGGEIRIRRLGASDPETIATIKPAFGRGIGVLDLARSVRAGDRPRADGLLGLHVLEAMTAVRTSIDSGRFEPVESRVAPSPLLPETFDPFAPTLEGVPA